MTYRSLLVHLDASPQCSARVDVAIRLAKSLDCHLVGLAPTGLIDLPVSIAGAASLDQFSVLAWDSLRQQADRATVRFSEACSAAGLKSFESVADDSDEARSLVRHVQKSDLAILGQVDPATAAHKLSQAIVEQVVLQSARPSLILPYVGTFERLGSRVMVAWDDSREAARAVADALPLLQRAERVQIVSWNESAQQSESSLPMRLDALHHWLMWHGVSADLRIESTGIAIAEAMLSSAADAGVDLIVMGAYGHSRWSELVLGGATRGLMASMTVPVLMSH